MKARNCRVWGEAHLAKVCGKCLLVGYYQGTCSFPPRCRFCFGDHLSKSHVCEQLNCPPITGEASIHTVCCCLLYKPSTHFVGYHGRPVMASANMTPPFGAPTAIIADATSATGIANNYGNSGRRQWKGRQGTSLVESSIDAADKDGTSIPSVVVQHQGECLAQAKALRLPEPPRLDKGKGQVFNDYEEASASSSNMKQVLAPSNTKIRSSGCSSRIIEIDDEDKLIYLGERMGFAVTLAPTPLGPLYLLRGF